MTSQAFTCHCIASVEMVAPSCEKCIGLRLIDFASMSEEEVGCDCRNPAMVTPRGSHFESLWDAYADEDGELPFADVPRMEEHYEAHTLGAPHNHIPLPRVPSGCSCHRPELLIVDPITLDPPARTVFRMNP